MQKNILLLAFGLIFCINHVSTGKTECPRIKLKRQWGGKPAKALTYQVRPIRHVIIHHTVSEECSEFLKCALIMQNIQTYHMNDLDYDDIGYNFTYIMKQHLHSYIDFSFLIGNDGVVYEGTGWGVRGAHTYGYNMNGTGIAFIGNYAEKLPTRSALTAAKKLLACGVKEGELDRNYILLAASQVSSTQSPGLILYNEIQEWDHWSLVP